jgi:hypothetical protein
MFFDELARVVEASDLDVLKVRRKKTGWSPVGTDR